MILNKLPKSIKNLALVLTSAGILGASGCAVNKTLVTPKKQVEKNFKECYKSGEEVIFTRSFPASIKDCGFSGIDLKIGKKHLYVPGLEEKTSQICVKNANKDYEIKGHHTHKEPGTDKNTRDVIAQDKTDKSFIYYHQSGNEGKLLRLDERNCDVNKVIELITGAPVDTGFVNAKNVDYPNGTTVVNSKIEVSKEVAVKTGNITIDDLLSIEEPLFEGAIDSNYKVNKNNKVYSLTLTPVNKQDKESVLLSNNLKFDGVLKRLSKTIEEENMLKYYELSADTLSRYLEKSTGKDNIPNKVIDLKDKKYKKIKETAKNKTLKVLKDEKYSKLGLKEKALVKEGIYQKNLINGLIDAGYEGIAFTHTTNGNRVLRNFTNPMLVSKDFLNNSDSYTIKQGINKKVYVSQSLEGGRFGELIYQPNSTIEYNAGELAKIISGERILELKKDIPTKVTVTKSKEELQRPNRMGVEYGVIFGSPLNTQMVSVNYLRDLNEWLSLGGEFTYVPSQRKDLGSVVKNTLPNPNDPLKLKGRSETDTTYSVGGWGVAINPCLKLGPLGICGSIGYMSLPEENVIERTEGLYAGEELVEGKTNQKYKSNLEGKKDYLTTGGKLSIGTKKFGLSASGGALTVGDKSPKGYFRGGVYYKF